MKTLPASETLLAVALLLESGCLVTGFQVFLGSAIEEVTSPPGGPFLGLTVTALHIALRILTTHPSSSQPQASLSSTTQPSTQLLGRLCVQL